jgi:hypothetical protein
VLNSRQISWPYLHTLDWAGRPARDKQSALLRTLVNYSLKKYCNLGNLWNKNNAEDKKIVGNCFLSPSSISAFKNIFEPRKKKKPILWRRKKSFFLVPRILTERRLSQQH